MLCCAELSEVSALGPVHPIGTGLALSENTLPSNAGIDVFEELSIAQKIVDTKYPLVKEGVTQPMLNPTGTAGSMFCVYQLSTVEQYG